MKVMSKCPTDKNNGLIHQDEVSLSRQAPFSEFIGFTGYFEIRDCGLDSELMSWW